MKFGMLLQLAIGPMCLMVFNTAKNSGFGLAMVLVLAITLVDAFYISLTSFGVTTILNNEKVRNIVKIIGGIVLIIFGINIVLNVFDINIIPLINIKVSYSNIFLQGLVLTLSNPLTIAFWGSVLSNKVIEDKLSKKELILFSVGLVSSTLIFLSFVAIIGTLLSTFISSILSDILNVIVGCIIVLFGIKKLFKEKDDKNE